MLHGTRADEENLLTDRLVFSEEHRMPCVWFVREFLVCSEWLPGHCYSVLGGC